jgi:phosphatidylserine decarboxylase
MFNDQKFSTQTINKTLNPVWDSVFDIVISHVPASGLLEGVCWSRDRIRKGYLGEFSQNILRLFQDGVYSLDDPANEVSFCFVYR